MLNLELSNEIIDPEAGFDQPAEEPRGGTAAYSDLYYYRRLLTAALERHTGASDEYLSADREQELAKAIQAGLTAQADLDKLHEEDPAQHATELEKQGPVLDAGKCAEIELLECNMRWARYLARASMNILPRDTKIPDEEEVDGEAVKAITGKKYIGAFADITGLRSPFADLKDRLQIANEGLLDAVRSFEPREGKGGKPIRFTTFATWRIQAALTKNARLHEKPGWYTPMHIVDQIIAGYKEPEQMTDKVRGWDEGRYTIPLESLSFAASDIEDEEEPVDMLSIADLAQDEREDVEHDALFSDTSQVIMDALAMLAEIEEIEHEKPAERNKRILGNRVAGIIAMRFGISDDPEKYGLSPSYDVIGKAYGVTRERIRQIESRNLPELRKILGKLGIEAIEDVLGTSANSTAATYLPAAEYAGNIRTSRTAAYGGRDVQGPAVRLHMPDPEEYRGSYVQTRDSKSAKRLMGLRQYQSRFQPHTEEPQQPISQSLSERLAPPRESWQTYGDEPFDMQEALGRDAAEHSLGNEEIAREFRDYLFHEAPDKFLDYFRKGLPTDYPILLVNTANRRFGRQLTAENIESFWNAHLETFISALGETVDDRSLSVVSSYFARLLAERMTDDSVIELRIPENLSGRLSYMGAFITNGLLKIRGDVGSFAGYKLNDVGKVIVHGSAGDFAGVSAGGYSQLEVRGDAGHFFGGQARGATEIVALGSVGDYCGEGMDGEEAAIFVGRDAGDEVASEAVCGQITIQGRAGTLAENRDPQVTIFLPGGHDNGDQQKLAS